MSTDANKLERIQQRFAALCLVFEFLLGISETLLCSMSAPHLEIVPLLDVHQLLMLSAGTFTYLEPGTFSSVILYNML
jgi:hypothetical protein